MSTERSQTSPIRWAQRLREAGLGEVAALLLEAAGPLSLLGAQLLYTAQPALGLFVDWERVDELAQLLEEPAGAAALLRALEETE